MFGEGTFRMAMSSWYVNSLIIRRHASSSLVILCALTSPDLMLTQSPPPFPEHPQRVGVHPLTCGLRVGVDRHVLCGLQRVLFFFLIHSVNSRRICGAS